MKIPKQKISVQQVRDAINYEIWNIGNSVLYDFLNELISRTSLIIALYESPGAIPCSHGEHMEIVGALKRRDAKKAAQFMDHHLQHIEAQIELSEDYIRVDIKSMFGKSD